MPDSNLVSTHYTHGTLLDSIAAGLERLGKTPETVAVEDLAPVEEFHIGGRTASAEFLEQLDLSADDHILDVGCGLGGTSRFVADRYGSRVTGIDLTLEYVETGRALCSWVGLQDRITLDHGSATELPYPDGSFGKAYMLHVGMNISDKQSLCSEVHRVLQPGGVFGIYDVMRTGAGELTFPVPWATRSDESAVAQPEEYKRALADAGFELAAERNRREFALQFFEALRASAAAAGGPPPLGLHILMGEAALTKVKNMIENVAEARVAPVELIARKPA